MAVCLFFSAIHSTQPTCNYFVCQSTEPNPKDQKKQLQLVSTVHLSQPVQTAPEGSTADLQVITSIGQQHTLVGAVDVAGRVNGSYIHTPGNWVFKTHARSMPASPAMQQPAHKSMAFDTTYKGSDFHAAGSYSSTGISSASYLQSVTPTVSLGIQAQHRYPEMSLIGVARYKNLNAGSKRGDVVTLTAMDRGIFSLSYARKVNENLTLASDFTYVHNNKKSQTSVGT